MDEDRFVYRADMCADDIPAVPVSDAELGVGRARVEFVPPLDLALLRHLPPVARLYLILHFANRVFGKPADDGWVSLSAGVYSRARLSDPRVRSRAVAALERAGIAEVQRRDGRTTLLRLKDYGRRIGSSPKAVLSHRT